MIEPIFLIGAAAGGLYATALFWHALNSKDGNPG